MNATTLLKQEHGRVRGLFERFRDEMDAEQRLEALREIAAEIVLHSQLEEEFFYPAIDESGDAEARQLVSGAKAAHVDVEELIERLIMMDGRGAEFERTVADLERNVQRHARDEEARLFPVAERVLGPAGLEAIGRAIESRRARLEAAA